MHPRRDETVTPDPGRLGGPARRAGPDPASLTAQPARAAGCGEADRCAAARRRRRVARLGAVAAQSRKAVWRLSGPAARRTRRRRLGPVRCWNCSEKMMFWLFNYDKTGISHYKSVTVSTTVRDIVEGPLWRRIRVGPGPILYIVIYAVCHCGSQIII